MPIAKINNRDFSFTDNALISDILSNTNFSLPCNCKGSCGKCKVNVKGELSPPNKIEIGKLSQYELNNNIRLACQTKATGNIEIKLENENFIISHSGFIGKYKPDPILDGSLVSIDIGTTTIAAHLYINPILGNLSKTYVGINEQSKYGADVISRIEYAVKNGVLPVHNTIINQIKKVLLELNCNKPDLMIITGNTTMLHFLTNKDVSGLAVAPFKPSCLFGGFFDVLGIKTYIPKCISAYVGADVVTGILASEMLKSKSSSLLVDIGTNGEIAYFDGKKIRTTSTAAGPVFEGAEIYMGVPAKDGAINKVFLENSQVKFTTINNQKPIGICGSGLIDAISVMLKTKALDETGILNPKSNNVIDFNGKPAYKIGDSNILITGQDIRKVQLAKAAISAGIKTLLDGKKVDILYISGGFGSYIDIKNAVIIGLIPADFYSEVKILGNSALLGADLILLSKNSLKKSEEIVSISENINLSSNPVFMDYYIDNMLF